MWPLLQPSPSHCFRLWGARGARADYEGWSGFPRGWRNYWHSDYWSFLTPERWTPHDYAVANQAGAKYTELVGMLYRAGVPLIAGTDTPAPWVLPGAGLLVELELMVAAGVPPMEALHAATGRAADILHKSDFVGTLRSGRSADFLILSAVPLTHIPKSQSIEAVYFAGKSQDLPAQQRAFQSSVAPTLRPGG